MTLEVWTSSGKLTNPEDTTMTDQKSQNPQTQKETAKVADGDLKPVGESSDPQVHQLIAELEGFRANGMDDEAKATMDRLKEMGYSAE